MMMKSKDKPLPTIEVAETTSKKTVKWSVYLIRTVSNHLYCGVTTDIERRLNEHRGSKKGAKYLKGKGPLTLAWTELVGDKKTAMQLEYKIKRLSKMKKESIVNGSLKLDSLWE